MHSTQPDPAVESHVEHASHSPREDLPSGSPAVKNLLTASQVQEILHVDRSTVYRMAEDGRLPAIRVGKQWRFPADDIFALVSEPHRAHILPRAHLVSANPRQVRAIVTPADLGPPPGNTLDQSAATAAVEVAADLLGVMMVVTDMEGRPITEIMNPCPWFVSHGDDPEFMAICSAEWHSLADDHNFEPTFHLGQAGFECARAFIRTGRELVGMVLAGGISQIDDDNPELHQLSPHQRARVLAALPNIATAISRQSPTPGDAQLEESQ